MSRRTKFGLIAAILIVVVGGLSFLTAANRNKRAVEVRFDTVQPQNLVASVTASGRIEPQTKVDISADITGRITQIAVKEGDWVKKGQFLLQIDPAQYEAAVARTEALLSASTASQVQAKANYDQAERTANRATGAQHQQPQPDLHRGGGTGADRVRRGEGEPERRQRPGGAEPRHRSRMREDQLAKTRLISPLDGRVTRLNVEVGEVAVPGTFSRETALLMTVADLSVILAKVQVDETDVVRLALGDSVRVTIDAFPDTAFVGRVTEDQQQRAADRDGHRRRLLRPRGGLRRRDHPGESAGGHPAGPERDRQDHHRHPYAGAERADHRPDGAAARSCSQRERARDHAAGRQLRARR